MTILIASDNKMREQAERAARQARSVGYDVAIIDVEGFEVPDKLPKGQMIGDITYTPKSQWKPYLLRSERIKRRGWLVYIDADVALIDNIDEIQGSYDIGVTERRLIERNIDDFDHINGTINAGVMFINDTHRARQLLDKWCDLMPQTQSGSDQEALTMLSEREKLRTFPTDIYNYYYFDERLSGTVKLLHFKGNYKRLWSQYVNEKN